ncbi:MAG: efflux RND transporter periplasmic adaptor subunit, partial [Tepidanaerobacteraceae bacterium]|nr:efflux RND transporter periplasmic adaptor subunit [Tepidanaerobacteraceae bacterium]
KVQPQTIASVFEEEGEIVPAVEHPVHSLLGGEIVQLPVEEGQQVKEKDLLTVVDTTELEFQLKQVEAQLKSLRGEEAERHQKPLESRVKSQKLLVEQAMNNLRAIEDDFERMEKLYDEGAITVKDYENAKNMLETAKINLEQQQEALALLYESSDPTGGSLQFYAGRAEALQSQIDLIKYQLEKSSIAAPTDGVVANLSVKKGDLISPGFRLMNIFQEGEYQIEVFIPAELAASVIEGMKVKMVQDRKGEDVIFQGEVEKIAPTAVERISALGLEEQRIKVTVKPELPQNLRFFPGTVLDVEFTTDKRENVLAVPKTTLFPHEKGEALWLVKDGKAKVQSVETGFENDSHVVITKGLAPGDLIILNPQLSGLKEGKKINKTAAPNE